MSKEYFTQMLSIVIYRKINLERLAEETRMRKYNHLKVEQRYQIETMIAENISIN